jgi:N-acetylglucosaminyldiphosphoundecaprenol N-acetyl-beta-D-mannosaminyltransferase
MEISVQSGHQYPPRVEILGIGVDPVSMEEALARIERFIKDGVPRMVITADSSGIVEAQSDVQWRDILLNADLVTPDSAGVVWASRRLGSPVKDRVSGVDLVERLCHLSSINGWRLFFLGAGKGIAEQAADKMRLKYPGVNIVGTHDGYFPKSDEVSVVAEVRGTSPDVVFVAMGIPKQEKFIAEHLYEFGAKVAMGVGGTFDVLSGSVRRAPRWVQKLRLEWFWRLILRPSKWRKNILLPKFWWRVVTSTKARN